MGDLQFLFWHVGELEIHRCTRTLQLNLNILGLLQILPLYVYGKFLRIAAYKAEVPIVQMQTKLHATGQVRLETLRREVRGFLRGVAERHRREEQRHPKKRRRLFMPLLVK